MKTIPTLAVLFFILLHTACPMDIKTFKFEHFDLEDGFSGMRVLCIYQDRQDFLWFSTLAGLNRYDGYEVKEFLYQPGDSASISHSQVNAMTEDDQGNLWLATGYAGLNKLRPDGEHFYQIKHNPADSQSLGGDYLNALCFDHRKNLWIGSRMRGGLNKLLVDPTVSNAHKKWLFKVYKNDIQDSTTISHSSVKTVYEDNAERLWIGTYNGLNRFDYQTGRFQRYLYNTNRNNPNEDVEINTTFQSADGTLWVGTENHGLYRYEDAHDRFLSFKYLRQNSIKSIAQDQKGFIWVGTWEDGIYLLNRFDEIYAHLEHNKANPYSLSGNAIHDIFVDRSGIVWIGTDAGCISKFDWKKQRFAHLFERAGEPYGLHGRAVASVLEIDDQSVLIGMLEGGLDQVNLQTGAVKNYGVFMSDFKNEELVKVNALLRDAQGTIWIGAWDGLCVLEVENDRIVHYNNYIKNPALKKYLSLPVECIYEDKNGLLWIGTHGKGLYKFDREHVNITYFTHDPRDSTKVGGNYIFCFYEDQKGNFWCGDGGLNRFDERMNTFRLCTDPIIHPDSSGVNYVGSIFEDQNGILWLTSFDKGLIKYDRQNNSIKIYTKEDGLADNTNWCTLQDNDGNLWLSSNKGITRFNPQDERVTNFDVRDGLQANQFFSSANLKGRSGRFYMGGMNGLTVFYPDSIKANNHVPEVVLTEFTIFNQTVVPGKHARLKQAITNAQQLTLSYRDYIFGFKFAALDYSIPEENQYAYRMEGLDADWIHTDSRNRHATYTNLDPGNYTFRVKASNNDGVWNEQGASIQITILPPWWQTSWAYGLYILLAGLLLYALWRIKVNRLRLQHQMEMEHLQAEKLQEMDAVKRRFFANISHEFRTPLTLILSPINQLITDTYQGPVKESYRLIRSNARRLLQLVNQLLALSKLEAGQLKLQVAEQDIISFLKRIYNSFLSLAERKQITFDFNPETDHLPVCFDGDKLETVMNNLLSNAFRFTPGAGRVELVVFMEPTPNPSREGNRMNPLLGGDKGVGKKLKIVVSNTGPGIPADALDKIFDRFYQAEKSRAAEGTGIGLSLAKDLIELHHGRISVESTPGQRTVFTILLPADEASYTAEEFAEKPATQAEAVDVQADIEPVEKETQTKPDQQPDQPTVLLVEDNTEMRRYLRDNLQSKFNIVEAVNGKAALDAAAEYMPELIISDVMMPEMDGFAFCEKVKNDARTSHIPLILLTARASRDDKLAGLQTGADDYLPKPFDLQELLIRAENLMAQRRNLRQRFAREALLGLDAMASTPAGQAFAQNIQTIIEHNIDNADYTTDHFARDLNLSRTQLFRKMKAWTGCTPHQFIRLCRLKKAALLLKQRPENITGVAYDVGFNNVSHFIHLFKMHFGKTPAEFSESDSPQT